MKINKTIIMFLIKNTLRIIIGPILSLFIRRNNKILLFSCNPQQVGDMFSQNTKYFFLYLNSKHNSQYKTVWICNNDSIIETLQSNGFKDVYRRYSLKGIYYALRAKYWFTDYLMSDLTWPILAHNAIGINFWHGIDCLKKAAEKQRNYLKQNSLQDKIYNFLRVKDSYYIINNEYESYFRQQNLGAKPNNILILGSPRFDFFSREDLFGQYFFTEEDLATIRDLKTQGTKLLFYTPTWRDTQINISDWIYDNDVNEFLNENNVALVCKLHPFDKNFIKSKNNKNVIVTKNNSDIIALLKYADALITDYSSISYDFLIFDKPIVYYVPDLKEYQEQCRDFHKSFEDIAAGYIAHNKTELFQALRNVIDGFDNGTDLRKAFRDKTFLHQDGKNCERILDFIESIENHE